MHSLAQMTSSRFLTLVLSLTAAVVQARQDGGRESLDRLVPEKCLGFISWNQDYKPDSSSGNIAERMLAEPEVRAFLEQVSEATGKIATAAMSEAAGDMSGQVRSVVPVLLRALLAGEGCGFIEDIRISQDGSAPRIEGAMLVRLGADAEATALGLAHLFARDGEKPAAIRDPASGAGLYQRQFGPDEDALTVTITARDGLLIAGSDQSVKAILGRAGEDRRPAWLTELRSRHGLARTTSLGRLELAAVRARIVEAAGPQAAEVIRAIGLDNVELIESAGGFDTEAMVSRVALRLNGAPRGALALFGDAGLQQADLSHVPDDSLFAVGLSLDPAKVLRFAGQLLQEFDPNTATQFEGGVQAAKRAIGVDLRTDIAEALGTTWCLYNGLGDGMLTGMALTVSVRNAERLDRALDTLSGLAMNMAANETAEGAPVFSRRTEDGVVIHSARFRGVPMPVEPSWALIGNRLVVSLYPQGMAPFLKKRAIDPLFPDEAYGQLVQPVEGDRSAATLVAFSYTDSRRQFEMAYPYAQVMLSAMRSLATDSGEFPGEVSKALEEALSEIRLPSARAVLPYLKPAVIAARRTDGGFEFESRTSLPMMDVTLLTPIGVGLLLPAVQQVREAARLTQGMNNLKQIGLALHYYEAAYKRFPAGWSADEDGKPLLSWRVAILPYIGENALYDEFHHNEPWDSPHNLALLGRMPGLFRSPGSNAGPGMTVYRGIGGARGILRRPDGEPRKRAGTRFADITDGASNTIMAIETSDAEAVPWTAPDAGIDPAERDFYSGPFRGGINALFADGAVRFIRNNIDPEMLRNAMMMNDGNPVWLDD